MTDTVEQDVKPQPMTKEQIEQVIASLPDQISNICAARMFASIIASYGFQPDAVDIFTMTMRLLTQIDPQTGEPIEQKH